MISVSAPGKLMIMGEHAVVYNEPCIVTAVNRRLTVSVEIEDRDAVSIHAPQVKETKFVDKTIEIFFLIFGKILDRKGVKLSIHSEFTNNVGFGSSSAVSVATARALGALFKIPLTTRQIFDIAYKVTLDIQGVGSGFDIAAAAYGGTLYFKKGGELVEPLSDNIPLIVGYTGVKADTPSFVRQVAEKHDRFPERINRIFSAIGKLAVQGRESIEYKDWGRLGKLMDFNQEYLRDLGVSTEKLENLISAAKSAGAYGAKLSGAGGGDCMIAISADDKRQSIMHAIRDAGGEVMNVLPNAEGVRVETTDNQEETFIVVDKDDTVIGYRTRYDCHRDSSLIHRTVGVLIFSDDGQLLLQRRSATKDTEPGKWAISCAGHVERGESQKEAVRRELKEELGIDTPASFLKKFIVADGHETEMASLYKTVFNGPFTPSTEEIEELQWVDPKKLPFLVAAGTYALSHSAKISLREAEILP